VVAVDRFADADCEVAVFGRTLQNLVDEEFRNEQKVIAATVRELLKAYLRSKHPAATADQLAEKHRLKLEGHLFDEEWLDIVRFMYGRKDSAAIMNRVRAIQRDTIDAAIAREIELAPIDNNTPGTRRRTTAGPSPLASSPHWLLMVQRCTAHTCASSSLARSRPHVNYPMFGHSSAAT